MDIQTEKKNQNPKNNKRDSFLKHSTKSSDKVREYIKS